MLNSQITADAGTWKSLDIFWNYFRATWLIRNGPDLWNISSFKDEDFETTLINRTNNPVERFNRRMNELLPSTSPSMVAFVNAIKSESNRFVTSLQQIQRGRQLKKNHAPVRFPELPSTYLDYIHSLQSSTTGEAKRRKRSVD